VQGLLSELVKERAEYQKKISEETNPEKIMGYQIEVASLDGRIANLESRLLKIS